MLKQRLHALGVGVTILALLSSATSASATKTHTIRKGDSLWTIAKKHHCSIDDIKRANGVSDKTILPLGKKLRIPCKGEAKTVARKHRIAQTQHEKRIARFARMDRQIESQPTDSQTIGTSRPGIVRTALAYRGSRYVRGGTGRSGFDCSGFTRFVYSKYGVRLPHCSAAQAGHGISVSRDELRPGDLVFFHTRQRRISHVGIYIGSGRFVHASTPRGGVMVSSLSQPYYAARYVGARRLKQDE